MLTSGQPRVKRWQDDQFMAIPPAPKAPSASRLVIYSINDVYELDLLPHLKSFIDEHKRMCNPEQVAITLNGDYLSPSTLSLFDYGKTMTKALNELGMTHLCLGNQYVSTPISIYYYIYINYCMIYCIILIYYIYLFNLFIVFIVNLMLVIVN